MPHPDDLAPHKVHDATLVPFVASCVVADASATTINRSLEIQRLPTHLQRMALFAVNPGLRDSSVCGLQRTWRKLPLPVDSWP